MCESAVTLGDQSAELRALQILNDLAVAISSELNLQALVQKVVDAGVRLTDSDFGAFFYNTVDDRGEALALYALAGAKPEDFAAFAHPRATPVFAPTFNGEGVVRSDDITADPRYGQWAPHHGMPQGHLPVRSYLAVPVKGRTGEVIGGLFFGHASTGRFSAYHERLITGMAAHAAVAVDNARLFASARAEIQAREQAEALYRAAELRLSAVLDNTNSAILVMNERQECIYMNAPAEALTGYRMEEVEGRPLHDVIHHTRPDGSPYPLEECPIDRAFPSRSRQTGEETFVRPDGSFYPVAFMASPVKAPDANVVGTVIEVRDLTEERRRSEALSLLMREVDHRARNNLTIVQSLIRMSTADDLDTFKKSLSGRVDALARAQTSLAERKWEGGCLTKIIAEELSALCPREVVELDGPEIEIPAEKVQPLSMVLHELATNANKYGACSQSGGRIQLSWRVVDDTLSLLWRESGGPAVTEPSRRGFGSRLIQSLAAQLGGSLVKDWDERGLAARLVMPLAPPSADRDRQLHTHGSAHA